MRLPACSFHPRLNASLFNLLISALMVLAYNAALWRLLLASVKHLSVHNVFFLAAFALVLTLLFNLFLQLISWQRVHKPLLILIVLSAAMVSGFMQEYGVLIDESMVRNAVETDTAEVRDLLSGSLLLHMLIWGVLPAWLIGRCRLVYGNWRQQLRERLLVLVATGLLIGGTAALFAPDFAALFRNHRQIRHLIVPSNYLYYGSRYLGHRYLQAAEPTPLQTIGQDARAAALWQHQQQPLLAVMVVGETARADHFTLNAYPRQTTPELGQRADLLNFPQASSCGTSTAVSVPCMFSKVSHQGYDEDLIHNQENVLDIIQRAGIHVLWRDNNSGCKGVCDRVETQPEEMFRAAALCNSEECFDEVMLNRLDAYLKQVRSTAANPLQASSLIVLHQKGSHGPAYSHRYPAQYQAFTPVCQSSALQTCSPQQIINAYDNSIRYTDHFLAQVIAFLERHRDHYTTAMLYMSDHGESLGEHNVYLHGLPYFMAPESQTHVPFVGWLSPEYRQRFAMDQGCLEQEQQQVVSHDNLFHSLLGLMGVETREHNARLDLFQTCRNDGGQA